MPKSKKYSIKKSRDTIYMKLVDEGRRYVKREVRITAMIADAPYIDVKKDKMRVDVERKLVALMKETKRLVWLRYFKFRDEELFKQFLMEVIGL